MDSAEVLYDAFKESYLQSRKLYRATVIISLFTLMVILLVVRDNVITTTSQPRMDGYQQRLQEIEQQLSDSDDSAFKPEAGYYQARKALKEAEAAVENWPQKLPARKKMKQKYEGLLKEYSGNHDKAMERLKIDGEPGLNLYQELATLIQAQDSAQEDYNQQNKERQKQERKYKQQQNKGKDQLQNERAQIKEQIKTLNEELSRIQHDETRLPWLGLRVNPRDILSLLPLLLMALYHILFDKFDEILSIMRNPQLADYRHVLRIYPVPVFLDRRNLFSWFTIVLLYGFIPAVQVITVLMIYHYQIGMLGVATNAWAWALGSSGVAALVTIAYPLILFIQHRQQIFAGRPENQYRDPSPTQGEA